MTQNKSMKHPVAIHILDLLESGELYRFVDLRPNGVESNLFSYHLSKLVRLGLVFKSDDGFYSLGAASNNPDRQSSIGASGDGTVGGIRVLFVVQNGYGKTLLKRRGSGFELPSGSALPTDTSLQDSAKRVFAALTSGSPRTFKHAGDCYVTTPHGRYFAHVMRLNVDSTPALEGFRWVSVRSPEVSSLPPGDLGVLSRTFFNDPFFFEEF